VEIPAIAHVHNLAYRYIGFIIATSMFNLSRVGFGEPDDVVGSYFNLPSLSANGPIYFC
jgi:hypothetical protein